MNRLFCAILLLAAAALGGCRTPSEHRAPIIDHSVSSGGKPVPDRSPPPERSVPADAEDAGRNSAPLEKDWRPQVYKVQKGDTLYSIAFNFGFDYHELAELNNIPNPAVIQAGQEIRLFPAAGAAAAVAMHPAEAEVKSGPLVVKLAYSEQAVAQIEKGQAEPSAAEPKATVTPKAGTGAKPAVEVKQTQPDVTVVAGTAQAVQWEMPASGKVIAAFSESDNRKGVDIAGKQGQPIFASAAGKVVYSGNGLRGYGKLVIIKHNATYLSAYAHNDKVLVKEGQAVAKGQMIAAMGSTDTDRVKLHFEIRKLGKPVDPAKYLAFPKS